MCVRWCPGNSSQLVSCGYDGALKLWDTRGKLPLHTVKAGGRAHTTRHMGLGRVPGASWTTVMPLHTRGPGRKPAAPSCTRKHLTLSISTNRHVIHHVCIVYTGARHVIRHTVNRCSPCHQSHMHCVCHQSHTVPVPTRSPLTQLCLLCTGTLLNGAREGEGVWGRLPWAATPRQRQGRHTPPLLTSNPNP